MNTKAVGRPCCSVRFEGIDWEVEKLKSKLSSQRRERAKEYRRRRKRTHKRNMELKAFLHLTCGSDETGIRLRGKKMCDCFLEEAGNDGFLDATSAEDCKKGDNLMKLLKTFESLAESELLMSVLQTWKASAFKEGILSQENPTESTNSSSSSGGQVGSDERTPDRSNEADSAEPPSANRSEDSFSPLSSNASEVTSPAGVGSISLLGATAPEPEEKKDDDDLDDLEYSVASKDAWDLLFSYLDEATCESLSTKVPDLVHNSTMRDFVAEMENVTCENENTAKCKSKAIAWLKKNDGNKSAVIERLQLALSDRLSFNIQEIERPPMQENARSAFDANSDDAARAS